jgi:hypothetical protein
MISLLFSFVVYHRGTSDPYDLQYRHVESKSYSSKLIIKVMLNQEGNFELTAQMFVEHANLVLGTNQATIL